MSIDFEKFLSTISTLDKVDVKTDLGVLLRMPNEVGFMLVSEAVEIPQLRALRVRRVSK